MPRSKPFPPPPSESRRIQVGQWLLDNVATHTRAGFDHIPDSSVLGFFWQFIDFLQQHQMLTRVVAASPDSVVPSTEIRTDDLTLEGFRFFQYAHGKWMDRLYKGLGAESEVRFLHKWYRAFKELPPSTFAEAPDNSLKPNPLHGSA